MPVGFNPSCPSCLSTENIKSHIGLTVIMIALFIIASLAAGGVLNSSMGVTSACYLCYGAYGGTVLFGILEMINLYVYGHRDRQKDPAKDLFADITHKTALIDQSGSVKPIQSEQKSKSRFESIPENVVFVERAPTSEELAAIKRFIREHYEAFGTAFIRKTGLQNEKNPIPPYSESEFDSGYLTGGENPLTSGVAASMTWLKGFVEERKQDIQKRKEGKRTITNDFYTVIHDYELLCLAIVNATPELVADKNIPSNTIDQANLIKPTQTELKPFLELKPVPKNVTFVEEYPTPVQVEAIKGFIKDYYDMSLAAFIEKNGLGHDEKHPAQAYSETQFNDWYLYGEDSISKLGIAGFMRLTTEFTESRTKYIDECAKSGCPVTDWDYSTIHNYELIRLAIVNATPELVADKKTAATPIKPVVRIAFVKIKPTTAQLAAIGEFINAHDETSLTAFLAKNGLDDRAKAIIENYVYDARYLGSEHTLSSEEDMDCFMARLETHASYRRREIFRKSRKNEFARVRRDAVQERIRVAEYSVIFYFELMFRAIINAAPELIDPRRSSQDCLKKIGDGSYDWGTLI